MIRVRMRLRRPASSKGRIAWTAPAPSGFVFLHGGILQEFCHCLQDFNRKRLIRYGACQRQCSDERAESQDGLRSCRTLVLVRKQTGNQLKVVPDLFGGKCAGLLIAARDLPRQSAEGTTPAWIVTMCFVQIVVDQPCVRDWRPAGCRSVHPALPAP